MDKAKIKADFLKAVENKYLVMIAMVFGFFYTAAFLCSFFPDVSCSFAMMGATYRSTYVCWGIVTAVALSLSLNFSFARYELKPLLSYIAAAVGGAAIIITAALPFATTGAAYVCRIFFAALSAAAYLFAFAWFCVKAISQTHNFLYAAYAVGGVTLVIIILMATLGISGILEAVPLLLAYVLLFLLTFTAIFEKGRQKPSAEENAIVTSGSLTEDYESFLADGQGAEDEPKTQTAAAESEPCSDDNGTAEDADKVD